MGNSPPLKIKVKLNGVPIMPKARSSIPSGQVSNIDSTVNGGPSTQHLPAAKAGHDVNRRIPLEVADAFKAADTTDAQMMSECLMDLYDTGVVKEAVFDMAMKFAKGGLAVTYLSVIFGRVQKYVEQDNVDMVNKYLHGLL